MLLLNPFHVPANTSHLDANGAFHWTSEVGFFWVHNWQLSSETPSEVRISGRTVGGTLTTRQLWVYCIVHYNLLGTWCVSLKSRTHSISCSVLLNANQGLTMLMTTRDVSIFPTCKQNVVNSNLLLKIPSSKFQLPRSMECTISHLCQASAAMVAGLWFTEQDFPNKKKK